MLEDLKKQYDIVYEKVSIRLEKQVESLQAIDNKASILLAVIGIVFAGYLQLLSNSDLDFVKYPYLVIVELLLFVVAGFYIFKSFILNNNEKWREDPRPKKLLDIFAKNNKKGGYWLKDQLIKSMSESYELNDGLVRKKYKYILIARKIFYAAIVVLMFHFTLAIFHIDKLTINLR